MLGIYRRDEGIGRTVSVLIEIPVDLHLRIVNEKYRRHPRSTIRDLVMEALNEKFPRGGGMEVDGL